MGYQAKAVLRSETPEAIIAAMYDLSGLTREETALLSLFAVLPAESIGFDTLESLLPDFVDLEQNALRLAQQGWIDYDEPNATFKCNPVVQEITRKKNPLLKEDCAALIASLIDKLDRETIHLDNYQQAAWCARYGESILNAPFTPDNWLSVLCDRMGYYYLQIGNLAKALSIYEKEFELVEILLVAEPEHQDYKNSLATTLSWLGSTQSAMGNMEKALSYYEQYNALEEELYALNPQNVEFKNGLAISYAKLAQFSRDNLNDKKQAINYFQQAEALWLELVCDAPRYLQFQQLLGMVREDLEELKQ